MAIQIRVVQPAGGTVVVENDSPSAYRVHFSPSAYYYRLVQFKVYCYACRQTLLTSSSNPATFNIASLEDQEHPGPFEITAVVSGAPPPPVYKDFTIKVITSSSPEGAGATNYEGGQVVYNSMDPADRFPVTLRASPNSGQGFLYWRNDVSGRQVSTNTEFTFNASNYDGTGSIVEHASYRFTAVFGTNEPRTITVGICSGSEGLGTVSGGGTYLMGDIARIVATPTSGYAFVGWSSDPNDPSKIVSSVTPYSLTVRTDAAFYAVFRQGKIRVRILPGAASGGVRYGKAYASGYEGGAYELEVDPGTPVTCVADVPGEHQWPSDTVFLGWYRKLPGPTEKVSTSFIYVFQAYYDTDLQPDINSLIYEDVYPVLVQIIEHVNCSVRGGGLYKLGDRVDLEAYDMAEGAAEVRWYAGGDSEHKNPLSAAEIYSFICPGTVHKPSHPQDPYGEVIQFRVVCSRLIHVSLSAMKSSDGSPGGGSVDGDGDYIEGREVKISALPADGFRFLCWSDGSTEAERTVTLGDQDVSLTAFFCSDKLMFDPSSGSLLYVGSPLLYDGAVHVPPFE